MSEQTKDPKTNDSPGTEIAAPGKAAHVSSADRRRSIIEAAEKRLFDSGTAEATAKAGDPKETSNTKTMKRKKSYALRGYYRQ